MRLICLILGHAWDHKQTTILGLEVKDHYECLVCSETNVRNISDPIDYEVYA